MVSTIKTGTIMKTMNGKQGGSVMKRVLSILCTISLVIALAIPFASCTKVAEDRPASNSELQFDIQVINASAPETKAVKTEWEVGDKIFVFFRKESGTYAGNNLYVTLTYNGTTWDASSTESGIPITWENGFTGPGTMYAVYFPFGNVVHPSTGDFKCSGYANEALNGIPPISWYMIDSGSPYTLSGTTVKGTLNMALPENFVYFYIDAVDGKYNQDGKYRLSVQGIRPSTVTNWSAGSFSKETLVEGQPMWGFKYGDGIAFAGIMDDSWASSGDHQFIFFSDGDPAVTKTFTGVSLASPDHASVKLKAPTAANGWQPLMAAPDYIEIGGINWAKWNLGSTSASDIDNKCTFCWAAIVPSKTGTGDYLDQSQMHDLTGDYVIFDPARAILGEDWRMPSRNDYISLADNCTLTSDNYLFTFTSKENSSKKVTFLTRNSMYGTGGSIYLWTSNVYASDKTYCYVREYHAGETLFTEAHSGEQAKRTIGDHFIRPIYNGNGIGGNVNKGDYTPTPLGE